MKNLKFQETALVYAVDEEKVFRNLYFLIRNIQFSNAYISGTNMI